jgi:hypothetical protein
MGCSRYSTSSRLHAVVASVNQTPLHAATVDLQQPAVGREAEAAGERVVLDEGLGQRALDGARWAVGGGEVPVGGGLEDVQRLDEGHLGRVAVEPGEAERAGRRGLGRGHQPLRQPLDGLGGRHWGARKNWLVPVGEGEEELNEPVGDGDKVVVAWLALADCSVPLVLFGVWSPAGLTWQGRGKRVVFIDRWSDVRGCLSLAVPVTRMGVGR